VCGRGGHRYGRGGCKQVLSSQGGTHWGAGCSRGEGRLSMGSVRVSRSLQENAAITLGRTAMVYPDQVRFRGVGVGLSSGGVTLASALLCFGRII
jgi:hypothetical protein